MSTYRYPSTDDDALAVQVERLRTAWHDARTDRDRALRAFYDAVRDELAAEQAFRAVVLDEPAS